MNKKLLYFFAFLLLPVCVWANKFEETGKTFDVDASAEWKKVSSSNPEAVLRLEKSGAHIEFTKQSEVLDDFYLKAQLKEIVDSVSSRGATFSNGEINFVSIHGVTNAYYSAYELEGLKECSAYFTYGNQSFALSSVGITDDVCRKIIASVCKPGTKCLPPCTPYNCLSPNFCKAGKCVAPPPCSPENCPSPKTCVSGRCILKAAVAKKPKKAEPQIPEEQNVAPGGEPYEGSISSVTKENVADSTATQGGQEVESTIENVASATEQAVSQALDAIVAKSVTKNKLPKHIRKPLPLFVWAILLGFWLIGSTIARGAAKVYKNPKLPPPAEDVPPDFFFPFVVDSFKVGSDIQYNISTRQRQRLAAAYSYKYVPFLIWPITGCVVFHIIWSLINTIGKNEFFISKIYSLPFGNFFSLIPEIIFIVPLLYGLYAYINRSKRIDIYDSRSTFMMSASKEGKDYCTIRDGKGKEVASLVKKSSKVRTWEFVDTDNVVAFKLVDDAPGLYRNRKLFGYLGGALRSRYGIFEKERRAGYVFLDPNSPYRFQIHMDFAFARIAHPAQMLAAILFVISYEKDSWYPTIF